MSDEIKVATVKVRVVRAIVEFELDLEEFDPETDQTYPVEQINEVDPRDDESVRQALQGVMVSVQGGPLEEHVWGEIVSVETFSSGESERFYQLVEVDEEEE